jgi:DNA-binding GntR family transcriptional regulator
VAEPVLAAPRLLQLQVYDLLRKRIVACEPGYAPGAQLNMTQLAAELKISITPIKDAIRRLQADGLVETKPRQGIFVSTMSNEDLEHLVAVRRGLEVLAADLFVPPVDPAIVARMEAELDAWLHERRRGDVQAAYAHHIAFHQLAVEASGNRFIERLYEQLHAHVSIAFAYYTRSFNQTDDEVLRHRRLLDALKRGDREEVRRRVAEHYRHGRPILGPEGEIPLAPHDSETAHPKRHRGEQPKKRGD